MPMVIMPFPEYVPQINTPSNSFEENLYSGGIWHTGK